MIISANRVDQLIKKFVPEKYWPSDTGPIRYFDLVEQSILAELSSKMCGVHDPLLVQGMCIDVNELLRKDRRDNFTILLSKDILLEDQMVFTMLHEVGHVDWHFSETKDKITEGIDDLKHKQELYADFFAFDRIADVLGMDRAFDMLPYVSRGGLGKKVSEKNV